jgi:signal transduction histidine kinase
MLLLLTVAVLMGGGLVWLGWQLVQQDRKLVAQRLQEQRDAAADLAVAALQESVGRAEEQLAEIAALAAAGASKRFAEVAAALPPDSALIVDTGAEVLAYPERRLPYYPVRPADREPPADLFAEADRLELQQQDYEGAMDALGTLAKSPDPAVRTAALLRIAHIRRHQEKWDEALGALAAMLGAKDAAVEGMPLELVALQQSIDILGRQGRSEAARGQAIELLRSLSDHRFVLTRGVYEFYLLEAQKAGAVPNTSDEVLPVAAAAEWLHANWPAQTDPSGRLALSEDGAPVLALWHAADDRLTALLLGPRWLKQQWPQDFKAKLAAYGASIRLTDASGKTVFGSPDAKPGDESPRMAADYGLPWNLYARIADPASALAPAKRRENLVFASMAAVAALTLGGAYLFGSSLNRELALSRLQSDFVTAVSHEFRTPLTSLCLLSEQLASGRVTETIDQQEYFTVLAHESQRLRRLVEGLLNFGRMEAGAAEYLFETVDPAQLVRTVSAEFERDPEAHGHNIEVSVKEDAPLVRADRAALACVIWNLIDNAVKYSPECFTVWADVERSGESAAIRIRDRGIGIPAGEQARIFDKFVRGEEAKRSSIGGTGIGLAIVNQIVVAHGGRLRVESKIGEGSSFTVLLPAVM